MFSKHPCLKIAAGVALLFGSASAFSQSVEVGSATVSPSDVASIDVTYTAPAASDIVLVQLDVNFDQTQLGAPDLSSCTGAAPNGGSTFCSNPSAGVVRIINDDPFLSPLASGVIATISWDTGTVPAGIGNYPLTVSGLLYSDSSGSAVPGAATDGSITIEPAPGTSFYSSDPGAGGLLDIGSALVGETVAGGGTLLITNLGDTAFDVLSLTASDAEVATPTTGTVAGNDTVGYAFDCTPDSRGANTGTITAAHNADGGPTGPSADVIYNYTCAGLTPDVTTSTASIVLNGLTTDAADPSDTVTVSNADDAFSAPADVTPTLGGANPGTFTVTPAGTTTIATGGNQVYTVSCDRTTAGNFSATIDFDSTDANGGNADTDSVTVTCEILDEFPTYTSDPAVGSTLAFGTVTNGTTSTPPIAIDVFNTGNGSGTASELTIGPATITGGDAAAFAVTVNNTGPYPVVAAADGGADIEVTCTPPAAAGALSATLEVTNNDTATPVTYPLTCSGQTDAVFGSNPADGGTLNLGVVPPATVTPPGDLVFSNTGSVDSYDVACTVTDPDGVFTFTPDPIDFTVAAGASSSAEFQCSPTAPGIFQADVACTITGADVTEANYFVTCQGQPLVIPTLDRWGLLLMALALLALGGLAGRRVMA